jgi:lysophospholipase L1-like esterase
MSTLQDIGRQFRFGFNMASGSVRSMWGDPDAWIASIRTFEMEDRQAWPAPGGILFVGSSSFTLWGTLEADMAPLPVLNRGFGGARLADVLRYAERIVIPYCPRLIVLFAGTNDIAWPRPASAQQLFEGYLAIERCIHSWLPDVPLYYIAITPTIARWRYWPIAQEANRLICEHTHDDPRLRFIDLSGRLLGPDGRPNRALFRADGLHPNARGYAEWTAAIKPVLQAAMAA